MNKIEQQSAAAIPAILLIGATIAWAGSDHGIVVSGFPLFALCGALSLAINWLVFVPAYAFGTERFFDLTGSLTYISLFAFALALRGDNDPRAWLITSLVVLWAARLGSFLFRRVSQDGGDGRFDRIKLSLPRFCMTWTLQALWVFLTGACGLAAVTAIETRPLGEFALIGFAVWSLGFGIEVAADQQKRRFRREARNEGRFIDTGIWAWSRHPNYFGEITLWVGIALIALPVLQGWQLATLVSPIFVYVLLTRISGVPMLEERAKKRWGHEPEYRDYLRRTPSLFPRPPKTNRHP